MPKLITPADIISSAKKLGNVQRRIFLACLVERLAANVRAALAQAKQPTKPLQEFVNALWLAVKSGQLDRTLAKQLKDSIETLFLDEDDCEGFFAAASNGCLVAFGHSVDFFADNSTRAFEAFLNDIVEVVDLYAQLQEGLGAFDPVSTASGEFDSRVISTPFAQRVLQQLLLSVRETQQIDLADPFWGSAMVASCRAAPLLLSEGMDRQWRAN